MRSRLLERVGPDPVIQSFDYTDAFLRMPDRRAPVPDPKLWKHRDSDLYVPLSCLVAFVAGSGAGSTGTGDMTTVASQNSTGGKASLGRITKRGDDYLRTLLIQGAKAAVMSADKRDDPTSRWLAQLTARAGWQKACVAMANKNARILWAVMTREEGFDPNHVSVKPQAKPSARESAAVASSDTVACPA